MSTIPSVSSHSVDHLAAHEGFLRAADPERGALTLVVRRPARLQREILAEALLDEEKGLIGDNWLERATRRALASGRHLDAQINVMGSRMVGLLADDDEGRAQAGDQLFLDLDLSRATLPTGARIALGDADTGAVIEVTAKPHTGCRKFVARYGLDAMHFVNSPLGQELRLRGLNARVVRSGTVRPGDVARRL